MESRPADPDEISMAEDLGRGAAPIDAGLRRGDGAAVTLDVEREAEGHELPRGSAALARVVRQVRHGDGLDGLDEQALRLEPRAGTLRELRHDRGITCGSIVRSAGTFFEEASVTSRRHPAMGPFMSMNAAAVSAAAAFTPGGLPHARARLAWTRVITHASSSATSASVNSLSFGSGGLEQAATTSNAGIDSRAMPAPSSTTRCASTPPRRNARSWGHYSRRLVTASHQWPGRGSRP